MVFINASKLQFLIWNKKYLTVPHKEEKLTQINDLSQENEYIDPSDF